jgi:ABC-type transport system involved in multi-copper enzyme maturation permease subunit
VRFWRIDVFAVVCVVSNCLYQRFRNVLAGPLFVREVITAPRQFKHFLMRAGYVFALFVLFYTAAQATFGWQQVRNIGELASFGTLVFQIVALVQLALVLFFAVLFAAGNVAQEKDRRTLLLLLMTDLTSSELVIGKLTASLLVVGVLLAISFPVMAFIHLLGGVSVDQMAWVLAISAAAGLTAGAWGTLVAFWREKTFQTLAISVLGIVLLIAVAEAVVALLPASSVVETVGLVNPFRAILTVLDPLGRLAQTRGLAAVALSCCGLQLVIAAALCTVTIWRLRVWYPPRTINESSLVDDENAVAKPRVHRAIWSNPVIWREVRTRAYGKKIAIIKLAYVIFAVALLWFASSAGSDGEQPTRRIMGILDSGGVAFVGLGIVCLMLVNAQAVTAFTNERDAATLELLLVTDVSAKEFIYGKIGGVLFNTIELTAVPALYVMWRALQGSLSVENMVYVLAGFVVLCLFAAMLGLHSGLTYQSSRTAIANSLGTMFFLFVGIFICMMLMVQVRSFELQLPCFLLFILGGGLGLWASLTHRNPSPALMLAAMALPFLTFYAITGFLQQQTLGVCLSLAVAYGFTTLAMLVPAISEFDVSLGRSNNAG